MLNLGYGKNLSRIYSHFVFFFCLYDLIYIFYMKVGEKFKFKVNQKKKNISSTLMLRWYFIMSN